ncbi:MAG TPA: class I SAM-dependent methyltransferase [Candidatus Mailhella merdigallinarum]|uniref:Class I SAM-dependent methyltransferase n=1 Tax=Candidatus Mailhella merdigallinarum TaxID=2838658 RepID=A0A9D2HAH2_9BACT|nr:class I SAM-dependent methyltransferase [Candidatus Mailhella merdigallinarum]
MDLKEISILSDTIERHWYYISKAKAMKKFFYDKSPITILDIGAGSGFFSRYLLSHTAAQEAWCVDISYSYEHQDTVKGKPIYFVKEVEHNFASADCMLVMDVLEHVDNDVDILKFYSEKLLKNSQIFISVPAFPWLWSNHDVFLEHKRRYTLHTLEKVVVNSGLQIEQLCYYFGLVFPLAAALRLPQKFIKSSNAPRSQLQRHSKISNKILTSICTLEMSVMKFNKICGLSVFCLATKK